MVDDKNYPPIEEQPYFAGVRVVDIGDYRVSRGMTRRPFSSCPHKRMVYDQNERRIWCKDCEKDVEPFDAFKLLAENFSKQAAILLDRENKIKKAENHNIISLAAKVIDEAWRKKKLVPCCPHCKEPLFPDDFKKGIGSFLGKSYALEMLRRRKEQTDAK